MRPASHLSWLMLATLAALLLAGCVGDRTGGRGSRLLPWNWGAPDHAGQLATQQTKTAAAEDAVTATAHRDLNKTVRTLEADPAPTPYTAQGLKFARHGLGLLDQVQPIPYAQLQADNQLVADLFSEQADIRLAALKREAADNATAAEQARALDRSRAREAELTGKLQESDRRYQAEAEQHRRLWFYVYAAIGVLLVGNLLRFAAQFVPALGGVSKLVGTVINPAGEYALHRAQVGLQRVGHAMSDVRTKLSPEMAEKVVSYFNQRTDDDHQQIIAAAANTAPRT
jgi:hypothetical protein